MTIIQAILLGAVQGVAEFLPISSSGHLAVAEYFLGHTDVPIIFDILLHNAGHPQESAQNNAPTHKLLFLNDVPFLHRHLQVT